MKSVKTISALIAMAMLLGTLAGCQSDSGKTKVSVSGWPNKDTATSRYESYQKFETEFEAQNPEYDLIGRDWNYDPQTFIAQAEAGDLPTLYSTYFTEADKIKKLGYAADLTQYLNKYGYLGKINETFMNDISEGGSIYLLPNEAYALGFYINRKLFEEAGLVNSDGSIKIPKTFDEVAEYAEIVKNKTGKNGFIFQTTHNFGGWIFTMLAWNFGTEFMKEIDGKWTATFGSQECADALDWLKDLMWNKKALPANTIVDANEILKMMGTGQVAMAILPAGELSRAVTSYDMDTNDVMYVTMPAGPKRHVTLMGGGFYVIEPNATPEQIDGAFKWLKFRGLAPEVDDEEKARYEQEYKQAYEDRTKVIGIKDISVWGDDADITKFRNEIMEKYRNIPAENVEDYNNNKDSVEYQAEEPINAQELYGMLDSCIQEVLTNKDADTLALVKQTAANFQSDFLDHVN